MTPHGSLVVSLLTASTLVVAACGGAIPTTTIPAAAVASSIATATPAAGVSHPEGEKATSIAPVAGEDAAERPAGWDEASHSNDSEPDYAIVFPHDRVNQITITIDAANWSAMQANMVELFGEAGAGGGRGAPGGGNRPPGRGGGQGRAGGNGDMTPTNPMWVSATISFNDKTWTRVGARFKGNSTLKNAWSQGSEKLPLKLDFDEFEDQYPEIKNQRFYGFKQLALGNNLLDATYLRETLAYGVIKDAGLVAPRTAFYEVLLDIGDGPESLGIYTMVEVVDDTVIESAFDDQDGNIYEADGPAASFAAGSENQIQSSFQKESNEEDADWSDIEELFAVLHSTQRTTVAEAWRASLEQVFDVGAFLKWLAVNSVIQDWDSYGEMAHNYYLYHNPDTDQLTWISWDHNEAFSERGRGDTTLDRTGVGADWPLIRFLLDDPIYHAQYIEHVRAVAEGPFDVAALTEKVDAMAELVKPYLARQGGSQSFDGAVTQLKEFIAERDDAVEAFLTGQD